MLSKALFDFIEHHPGCLFLKINLETVAGSRAGLEPIYHEVNLANIEHPRGFDYLVSQTSAEVVNYIHDHNMNRKYRSQRETIAALKHICNLIESRDFLKV